MAGSRKKNTNSGDAPAGLQQPQVLLPPLGPGPAGNGGGQVVNENGTISGSRANRKGQPVVQQLALRDHADNLSALFTHVDYGEGGELEALKWFFNPLGHNPWDFIGRGESKSWDDVRTKARALLNELEDLEDEEGWAESPFANSPPGVTFVQLYTAFSQELDRVGRWEALQFYTGVVAPDLLKSSSKHKD